MMRLLARFHTTTTTAGGSVIFIMSLNALFWRVIDRQWPTSSTSATATATAAVSSSHALCAIGRQPISVAHLNMMVEALVEIMHAGLLVEFTSNMSTTGVAALLHSPLFSLVFDCYARLVCSHVLEVNLAARRQLLHLLKPAKKQQQQQQQP